MRGGIDMVKEKELLEENDKETIKENAKESFDNNVIEKDKEKDKEKDREKEKAIAVKDINDDSVDVNRLDPETLEVEKLIDPEEVKEEPIEVPNYEEEIVKIIRGNSSPKLLRSKLEDYHDNSIADAMQLLKKSERQKLYRILDPATLGAIFEYVSKEDASTYINEMDLKKASNVISELEPDTAVDILRELEKGKRTLLIDSMESDVRKDIKVVASFDEDEIGSEMTTNFILIHNDLSVKQAMRELVSQAGENDNITTIYVCDEKERFYGAIDLKDLIVARVGDQLEDLISTSYPYVRAHDNISECIDKIRDYAEDSIPVLSDDNRILGIFTAQDIIEVVDELPKAISGKIRRVEIREKDNQNS